MKRKEIPLSLRFPSPSSLRTCIRTVAKLAAAEDVRVALVGCLAMQHYGSRRIANEPEMLVSQDIVELAPDGAPSLGWHSATVNGQSVGYTLFAGEYPELYNHAINTAVKVPRFAIPIVRAEELTAVLLASQRPMDSLDLDDLMHLGAASVEQTEAIIREHLGPYAVQMYRNKLERIAWEKHRGISPVKSPIRRRERP